MKLHVQHAAGSLLLLRHAHLGMASSCFRLVALRVHVGPPTALRFGFSRSWNLNDWFASPGHFDQPPDALVIAVGRLLCAFTSAPR